MDITYIIEQAELFSDAVASIDETTQVVGNLAKMGALIGSGVAVGVAGLGVGLGQGIAAGLTAQAIARNPEMRSGIMSSTIIGMAISESSVIYGLVIAILLIFVA